MTERPLLAISVMSIAMVLIPVGDALAKLISNNSDYGPGFLAWTRFAFGMLFLVFPVLFAGRFRGLGKHFYLRQALRGFCISMTLVLIITAVSLSPLADVFGAFFVGPVIATILGVLVLKERVGWIGWASVALGFIGVLMVVQPGLVNSSGLYFGLAAGIFYGCFLTATRWAAASGPPMAQLAAQMVFGFFFLMPFALLELRGLEYQNLSFSDLVLPMPLFVMGATSAGANLLSIIALKNAPAAYLAPVVYLQIVAATFISILFFGDSLNTLALAGLGLIIFTGLLKIPQAIRA